MWSLACGISTRHCKSMLWRSYLVFFCSNFTWLKVASKQSLVVGIICPGMSKKRCFILFYSELDSRGMNVCIPLQQGWPGAAWGVAVVLKADSVWTKREMIWKNILISIIINGILWHWSRNNNFLTSEAPNYFKGNYMYSPGLWSFWKTFWC